MQPAGKRILLSFDVEEFDMPLEYNCSISVDEQFAIGFEGLSVLMPMLEKFTGQHTFFTTANFAQRFPETIKAISQKHEIASHTYYHSYFVPQHLASSRITLEAVTGKPVHGLRMPRMAPVNMADVYAAGYRYDSSLNPTWLPGRYNNLSKPRVLFRDEQVVRVPASVTPVTRIPLFWLSFKNLPYGVFKQLVMQALNKDGYVCLYFHPWEFADITGYNIPFYTKRDCRSTLLIKLQRLIKDLSQVAVLTTISQYLDEVFYKKPVIKN